jgi:hypothetical protein
VSQNISNRLLRLLSIEISITYINYFKTFVKKSLSETPKIKLET